MSLSPSSPPPPDAPSVDPGQIARFDRLARSWWDPHGPFWPLHVLNQLRTDWILQHLCQEFRRDPASAAPLEGLRVLDIGCGGGLLAENMAKMGAMVVGIDVTPRNILIAEQHARQSPGLDVTYRLLSLEEMDETDFDVVLNMEVLEHVLNPMEFLRLSLGAVRTGGMLVVATINRTFAAYLTVILGAEYLFRILPRGTHEWRRFIPPDQVELTLKAEDAHIVARSGIGVNPLTRKMWLRPYEGINYMMLYRKNLRPG